MGYRIKSIREKLGLSQVQLAKKSGVSRTTISGLESGEERVTTTLTLKKIAEAMNVTIDELFTDDRTA